VDDGRADFQRHGFSRAHGYIRVPGPARASLRASHRDRIVHPCAYTRGKLQHRAFIPYRTRAVTQFRRAECDTFSCVIKSRVTRALYIIHAAASRHPAFAIAHPRAFLSLLFPAPSATPPYPPPCSLRFLFYVGGLISRGRAARDPRKTHRMPAGTRGGNFIGPTRSACAIFTGAVLARPLSQLFPVKCHKAKFPGCVALASPPGWLLAPLTTIRTLII